jgi:hypothetical protein
MQAHREGAHHPGDPVAWVLFTPTKEENDRRVGQGKIDPIPTGRADPKSPNFDTIANAQHWFNVGFQKATGRDPR